MHRIEIGKLTYRYLAGPYTVGILPPSRKKHVANLSDIRAAWDYRTMGTRPPFTENGTSDGRITPEEIVAYILKNKLV